MTRGRGQDQGLGFKGREPEDDHASLPSPSAPVRGAGVGIRVLRVMDVLRVGVGAVVCISARLRSRGRG